MLHFLSLPYYYIKNLQYNRQAGKILERVLIKESNCIDIGCHKGSFFKKIISLAPEGRHWCFEPLPHLHQSLIDRFKNPRYQILPFALSNTDGITDFQFVKNSPGYSGFRKRIYHIPFPKIEKIQVEKKQLDALIPPDIKIDLIKIDVEGAELEVLEGGKNVITQNKPIVIFEFGTGAAPFYNSSPGDIYNFFKSCNMHINSFKGWLSDSAPLSPEEFSHQYYKEINYYFIAYP